MANVTAPAQLKLVWNIDNIRDIAESVGISHLSDDAIRNLSQDAEYRVGQVLVEAMRFMHHGKRTVLGTQDISQALKVLDVEPLYGYESTRPLRFGEASIGPGQPLFYLEDEEVDFEKLINAPLPKVPRDMSFTAHWLAVEGVQPSIPQNPTTAESRTQELLPKGPSANPSLAAMAGNDNVAVRPMVKHILSKELILYFDKIRAAILDEEDDEEVVRLREAAFESVRSDPGLHQLVPYFVQFIADKVTHSLKSIFPLHQTLRLASAMIDNKSLHVAPYVSSLMPSILTCLLGRRLGPDLGANGDNGSSSSSNENAQQTQQAQAQQYQLRELAISLVGVVARKYRESSHELQSRLARTCLKHFLDPTRPLAVHYGAIGGLAVVGGPEVVRALVLPNLKNYGDLVLLGRAQQERLGGGHKDVEMVVGAILKALLSLLDDGKALPNGTGAKAATAAVGEDDHTAELEDYLGQMIGARLSALKNPALERTILDTRR